MTISEMAAADGHLVRTMHVNGSLSLAPASGPTAGVEIDRRSRRLVVVQPGLISLLDAENGRLLHTVSLGPEYGWATIDGLTGRVFFVASRSGAVAMLDEATGRLTPTATVAPMVQAVVVDNHTGRVVVVSMGPFRGISITPVGNGAVGVLDGRSGVVLRTISVAIAPLAIGLDERNGHAIVFSQGGSVDAPDPWAWLPRGLRQRIPFLPASAPRHAADCQRDRRVTVARLRRRVQSAAIWRGSTHCCVPSGQERAGRWRCASPPG